MSLYPDNASTLRVTSNRHNIVYYLQAKLIALRYLFIQNILEEGIINIAHVNTHD